MNAIRHGVNSVLFAGVLFTGGVAVAAELKLPESGAQPAELVKAALRSELDGPSDARGTLLHEALSRDPDFAPARWQLGFVKWDNDWVTLDEAAKRAGGDKQLAAYRKQRDALVDTADNNRSLARWCHKNRLLDEERIHWAKVLEFEPGDAEALAAMGLQLYQGRLLTRKQIEETKKQAGEQLAATRRWQPQLVKWRAAIEHGSPKDLDESLRRLKDLSDPGAIPALEAVFAVNATSPKSTELNRLLIETVGRFPHPDATQVLLRRALVPDAVEVRAMAADELKKRPMHAYVPQLIAALPAALKTQFHVYVAPNGTVVHEHEMYFSGNKADFSWNYASTVSPTDMAAEMFVTPASLNRELRSAAIIENRAHATEARLAWMRDRIRFALERTTGFVNVDDPQLWEKQFNDYNGWYTPTQTKPVYDVASANFQAYFTAPVTLVRRHSCFSAGTLVLTLTGARPIEDLKAGDRVLAQNAMTGELTFKPVQITTLRPVTPLVKITLGSHSVTATPGHPFWVIGEGWRTAKHLQAGDRLHGLNGGKIVENIEDVRPSEVYNLVVSEYHNYFVGDAQVLVHDNSPLEETFTACPGLPLENR